MTRSIRSGANRGCLLSLVAKEKGRAFFVVIVGGSHEIFSRIPYHATHGDLSIRGSPLEQTLKG